MVFHKFSQTYLFHWMLGFSPLGSLFLEVSLKEALSSSKLSLVKCFPSHFFQATPAAPLWEATAPLMWEVTMNQRPSCQSQTTSKFPIPVQSGTLGFVPTVRICPFLVQLWPKLLLQTIKHGQSFEFVSVLLTQCNRLVGPSITSKPLARDPEAIFSVNKPSQLIFWTC